MSSMVEVPQYPLAPAHPGSSAIDQPEKKRETNLVHMAWRGRWLILLCMLIGAASAWVALQRITPRFKSVSRIYVERNLPKIFSADMQVGQSATYLYTQAELIRSTPVLSAVANSPEFAKLPSLRDVDNPVGLLQHAITVTVGQQDDIINVWGELPNREDAARLVNAVVDAYITKYAENRRSNTVDVLKILRNEKEHRDAELEQRRKELAEFRKQHPALSLQFEKENIVTRRFSQLSEQLSHTEIELLEARARYQRTKELFDKPSERMHLLETAAKEKTALHDADLEGAVQQVEQALTSERAHWGEGNPRVKMLRESATELRAKLKQQQEAVLASYLDGLRQEYEILEQKQKELRTEYDQQFRNATDLSTQELELASLEEAFKRTEEQCDIFDKRIKEVNLSEDVGAMNVSIMETATAATLPSYPIHSRFLIIGLLIGGLVGSGFAWLRDLLDHRLKTVEEIASVLELPVLGALPHFGNSQESVANGRLVYLAPRSAAAEAVRTLRTALHFGLADRADIKAIVITSPTPGDGKSTIASNLAIAMAQSDQRVLLIDADLRRPTQHLIHEVSAERGLGSVLTDRRPVAEAVHTNVLHNLDLLPCGPLPNNPVELLNNGFFADLLLKLRDRYDRIIIDAPPVMPLADARVIAALADATLLVVRADQSTRRLSLAARNELWRVRATRLGVVVNGISMRKHNYGYAYGGDGYGYYGYVSEDPPNLEENGRQRTKQAALIAKTPSESESIPVADVTSN
jgi:polysaccharide biosynthesis transport protein